jgi:hypothetical protein
VAGEHKRIVGSSLPGKRLGKRGLPDACLAADKDKAPLSIHRIGPLPAE